MKDPHTYMVVKDRVGRPRYIVFKLEPGGLERRDMIRAINSVSSKVGIRPAPRLTVFDGTKGILKCDHREASEVREMLQGIKEIGGGGAKVVAVRTSGTLRKAKEYLD